MYQCHCYLAYGFSGSAKEIFCCAMMKQDLSHMFCAGVSEENNDYSEE